MDITWLFLVLCPYMLVYFYLWDFTSWPQWKIALIWVSGLMLIIVTWLIITYLNPSSAPFPALF